MQLNELLKKIQANILRVNIDRSDVVVGFVVSVAGYIYVKHSLSPPKHFKDIDEAIDYIQTRIETDGH